MNPPGHPMASTTVRALAAGVIFFAVWLPQRLPSAGAAEDAMLRAGVAMTDITPDEPVTLAGYGSRKDVSRGVHDPLSARAIAFERDGKRLVLVSTDLIGFYGGTCEVMREAILEAAGLEPSELFLTAIHTHAGPSPALEGDGRHPNNVAYTKALKGKLVDLVKEALAKPAPARIAAGSGSSPVGVNRREIVRDDSGGTRIVLGRNPDVLTDREVQVLEVMPAAAEASAVPRAVLFAYATHSTSLGPRNYLVSGDIHGIAEQFLEKHIGGGLVAAAFAGASGDIDPWCRVLPEFKTERGWIPEPILLGTLLGEEVAVVLERAREVENDGPIRTDIRALELPGKVPAEVHPGVQTDRSAEPARISLTVTVARVGGIAFVGLGAEVFNEIGKEIKTASPYSPTLVMTHCNGEAGYLPTEAAYPEGGYEVRSSRFAPSAAATVVAEITRMLKRL